MKILIDNGHGLMTPGKRSPDGQFREAIYAREIANKLKTDLLDRGYDAELLTPEDDDIPLSERVRRVNLACLRYGKSNVILISIHVNAAGNGSQWMNATGWSCYTSKGQTESDKLADCLYEAAIKNFPGKRIRTDYSDNDPDWEENFYILRHTLCPTVLIENFFMDSLQDRDFLLSDEGLTAIVNTVLQGLCLYLRFS